MDIYTAKGRSEIKSNIESEFTKLENFCLSDEIDYDDIRNLNYKMLGDHFEDVSDYLFKTEKCINVKVILLYFNLQRCIYPNAVNLLKKLADREEGDLVLFVKNVLKIDIQYLLHESNVDRVLTAIIRKNKEYNYHEDAFSSLYTDLFHYDVYLTVLTERSFKDDIDYSVFFPFVKGDKSILLNNCIFQYSDLLYVFFDILKIMGHDSLFEQLLEKVNNSNLTINMNYLIPSTRIKMNYLTRFQHPEYYLFTSERICVIRYFLPESLQILEIEALIINYDDNIY